MKRIILFTIGLVMSIGIFAQDKIETTISGDIVSSYICRGLKMGNVSIQPTLGVSYKGLSLIAWGSVGFNSDDMKELDLSLGYTIGKLNIGITDYWFSKMDGGDPDGRYFRYNAHSTNHVFEANIGYNFGFTSLQWFTYFTGNDYKADGKRAYSSYMEITVPFKLSKMKWTATGGIVPFTSGLYATNGFAVTNLSLRATKDIKVTDSFSIPIFGQVVANPCSQKAYFILGFTLKP